MWMIVVSCISLLYRFILIMKIFWIIKWDYILCMYIYRLVNFFIGVYVYVNFVYYKLFRKKDVCMCIGIKKRRVELIRFW